MTRSEITRISVTGIIAVLVGGLVGFFAGKSGEQEHMQPILLAQDSARYFVEQYGKITGDSTKGFSISKELITQLSTYVYPSTTPIDWYGFQIYYGKNDVNFEFICVPLDKDGAEIQNSTLLFIPSITAR
ncbi:MAG: hypothetical protein ABIV51_00120, partial [Saprospiraceae bacterium]